MKATADVGLPAIGPDLVSCLEWIELQLDGCGADPVQVAVRGDARGVTIAVGCIAGDVTDASIEALEIFTAALRGAGLTYADVRLA